VQAGATGVITAGAYMLHAGWAHEVHASTAGAGT
jgi:hypothetical protein